MRHFQDQQHLKTKQKNIFKLKNYFNFLKHIKKKNILNKYCFLIILIVVLHTPPFRWRWAGHPHEAGHEEARQQQRTKIPHTTDLHDND